jgi:hypothetical protein
MQQSCDDALQAALKENARFRALINSQEAQLQDMRSRLHEAKSSFQQVSLESLIQSIIAAIDSGSRWSKDLVIAGGRADIRVALQMGETYLFSWDEVADTEKSPGKEKYKLIYYLRDKFGLDWLDPVYVIIRKIDNGNTLNVKGPFVWPPSSQNYILIKLNESKTRANLTISTDKRTDEFVAKMEIGKLNIYERRTGGIFIEPPGVYPGEALSTISIDIKTSPPTPFEESRRVAFAKVISAVLDLQAALDRKLPSEIAKQAEEVIARAGEFVTNPSLTPDSVKIQLVGLVNSLIALSKYMRIIEIPTKALSDMYTAFPSSPTGQDLEVLAKAISKVARTIGGS